MESEEETEKGRKNGKERKKRKKEGSSDSESDEEIQSFAIGMTAEAQIDGLFSDPQAVGKFVEKRIGKVNSVRITRNGLVIIECKDKEQVFKALNIQQFNKCYVKMFHLEGKRKVRGVISGVPLTVKQDHIVDVDGVCEARRLTRFKDGKREESSSVCLTFEGNVLPDRVYIEYMSYRVRPYERAPLRCYCCQLYGHVAAVCRGTKTCGRGGKEGCKGECEGKEEIKCIHCGGHHYAGSAQCPRKIKEVMVHRMRTEKKGISYAEAVRKVEGTNEERKTEQKKQDERRNDNNNICMDKTRFLAFIAMVINCAVEISRKTERITMVLEAARRFLNVVDVTGEDLDAVLREGVTAAQT